MCNIFSKLENLSIKFLSIHLTKCTGYIFFSNLWYRYAKLKAIADF